MSEKVTFSELVEIIAEESEHSKQFTHDFLKDLVSVINDGLESEGSVNIAGWGKFDLKRVDEREGYNPQTEEKITIPAHNKIVFKPYKDVRELINAPYAHMEPELIEESEEEQQEEKETGQQEPADSEVSESLESSEEQESPSKEQEPEQESTPTEEQEPQDDFIPMAPPTQLDKEEDATESAPEESIGQKQEKEEQEEEPEPSPAGAKSETETEAEERTHPESTVVAFEAEEMSSAAPLDRPTARRKNTTSIPMVVAASFLLILIAGAAWYFSILSDQPKDESNANVPMETRQTVDNATGAQPAEESVQKTGSDSQEGQGTSKGATSGTDQSATASAKQSKSESPGQDESSSDKDINNITIARGQTLWSIAEDTYGNPRLWPWIYGTNEPLDNPNVIIAGNPLDVPLPSGPNNSLNSADSVGVSKGFLATYRWYKDHRSEKAKNHLWAAKLYYDNLRDIADVQIDQADLKYANQAR